MSGPPYIAHAPHFVSTIRHDTYPAIDPTKANLVGKFILITGASRGIGQVTAVALAQAGASGVALFARSDTSATRAAMEAAVSSGSALKILSIAADVSDTKQAEAAVARVREEFGRLDVVINNAAIATPMTTSLHEADANEWWRVWEVNMRGVYNITRTTIPLMLTCGGDKTIINIVSDAAHWVLPKFSSYVNAKFAVIRFTEQLMAEYGDQGVLAIALHPCSTPTDITPVLTPEIAKLLVDTPELAAHTMVWLIKQRREWLGGRYVSSCWDVDELLAKRDEIVAGDKLKLRMVV